MIDVEMPKILKYCHCVIRKDDILDPGEDGNFYHDVCGKAVKLRMMPIRCEGCED